MVYIYNGILLSYKKDRIWVRCNKVDEPRACYTKWSKSARENQISYIYAYIWNLEKWYWWTSLQRWSGDSDVENGLVDTVGKENLRQTEIGALTCIHYYV